MQNRLEYAERRLEEEIKNGEMRDIQYWRGYRDAVKQVTEESIKMDKIMIEQLLANQTAIMSAIASIIKGGYRSDDALKILDIGVQNTCELMGYEIDENENS